jgi:VanZ family protein
MRELTSAIRSSRLNIRLLARWAALLLVGAVGVFTLAPIELRPVTAAPANWERFAAFTVMGALFCLGYPHHRLRVVALVIGAAGALEVLQHLNPSRHGRLPDGAVKAAGALWGVVLVVLAERALERLRLATILPRGPRLPS